MSIRSGRTEKNRLKKLVVPACAWISIAIMIMVVIFGTYHVHDWLRGGADQLRGMMRTALMLIGKDGSRSVSVDIYGSETDVRNPLSFTSVEMPVFPDTVCNIVSYGAIDGGYVKNTDAFEKAVADCSRRGGGKVSVPAGKWLTGPIHLRNNIDLDLDKDAEILFSTDLTDYLPVVFSRFEGVEYYNYSPPIYAKDCHNIAVTGKGTLNGQGRESWWKLNDAEGMRKIESARNNELPTEARRFGTPEAGLRPAFVQFVGCRKILLSEFTLINSPMWAINPVYSEDIIVRGVQVLTEGGGHNNDGIDIDSSRNVLVEDSFFNTGDDAIVIKSGSGQDGLRVNRPSENIVIRNTKVLDGHAGVAIGSEISGGVRNVFVYHCDFENSQYGFRLKTTLVDGGTVENVWVRDIGLKNMWLNAIEITNEYGTPPENGAYFPPHIGNVHVENVRCDYARGAIALRGSERASVRGISFEDIVISSKSAAVLNNASDVVLRNVAINSKHASDVTDVKRLTIVDYACARSMTECLWIHGTGNEGMDLKQSAIPSGKMRFAR